MTETAIPRILKTLPERIASAPAPVIEKGRFDASVLNMFMLRLVVDGCFKDGVAAASNEWADDFKRAAQSTEFHPALFDAHFALLKQLVSHYGSRMTMAAMVRFFSDEKSKSFLLGTDFFSDFRNVKLSKLAFHHLPEAFSGFIALPEPLTDLEGNSFRGFFAVVAPLSLLEGLVSGVSNAIFGKYPYDDLAALFSYIDERTGVTGYLVRPFPKDRSMLISESLEGSHIHSAFKTDELGLSVDEDGGVIEGYPEYQRILFNSLVYVASGQPDIRLVRQTPRLRGGPGSKIVNKDKDLSSHDVFLVNHGWLKKPLYVVGKWSVSLHEREITPRDGGPPRLVFVKAHERHRRAISKDRGSEKSEGLKDVVIDE